MTDAFADAERMLVDYTSMVLERLIKEDAAVQVTLAPDTALVVVGIVQMALRHPEITPPVAAVGRQFVDYVRQQLPDLAPIIDAGWFA